MKSRIRSAVFAALRSCLNSSCRRANCARCHSVERTGDSALKLAPPFRTLHQRYPVEYLEESLAEGMVTGHPDMPEFRLEPDQIADFIDFLKAFEE